MTSWLQSNVKTVAWRARNCGFPPYLSTDRKRPLTIFRAESTQNRMFTNRSSRSGNEVGVAKQAPLPIGRFLEDRQRVAAAPHRLAIGRCHRQIDVIPDPGSVSNDLELLDL